MNIIRKTREIINHPPPTGAHALYNSRHSLTFLWTTTPVLLFTWALNVSFFVIEMDAKNLFVVEIRTEIHFSFFEWARKFILAVVRGTKAHSMLRKWALESISSH